jgi:hypothetical protein
MAVKCLVTLGPWENLIKHFNINLVMLYCKLDHSLV